MNKPEKKTRAPGAGRKTSRPIYRGKPVYLFKDQLPITPDEVRAAVDQYLKKAE